MDETSSYEDIRSLVIGYEKITSWSPGKIHSELGIVSPPNLGPAPMEVDLVSTYPKGKGKQKGKPGKGTQKGKDGGKSKGSQGQKGNKGSSAGKDGKGKGSSTTATCFHCGKPGHTKRDCWQLNGRPGSKKVSIVSADDGASVSGSTTGSTTSSVPTSASTAGNSGNANSVRLFSSTVTIEEVPESDSDGDVIDLTAYDHVGGSCMMVSLMEHFTPCESYMRCSCPVFDVSYSDLDDSWTFSEDIDIACISTVDTCDCDHIRAAHHSGGEALTEIVFDLGADGSVLPASFLSMLMRRAIPSHSMIPE
jgi:hypothetical protein